MSAIFLLTTEYFHIYCDLHLEGALHGFGFVAVSDPELNSIAH